MRFITHRTVGRLTGSQFSIGLHAPFQSLPIQLESGNFVIGSLTSLLKTKFKRPWKIYGTVRKLTLRVQLSGIIRVTVRASARNPLLSAFHCGR